MHSPLFQLSGTAGDLFSDAFLIDNNRLMFASLYGREANIQALLATLTLGNDQIGFRLSKDEPYFPHKRTARYFSALHKRVSKIHTHNYGVLTHLFLYAEEVLQANHDTRTAWLLQPPNTDTETQLNGAWQCIQALSDVPLLDDWRDAVLERLISMTASDQAHNGGDYLIYHNPPDVDDRLSSIGGVFGIKACCVRLPENFDEIISTMLKTGQMDFRYPARVLKQAA
ncbi:hypothetical protein [Stenoxybacter acetivorans]|uniref:hypothetical protein n=1 Tax=Stenoxybacter acetivorans TaxID=422441 RepID=UPI000566EA6D|nr:hypothetical protein [Stenoxybacter acetivorans]